MRNAHRHVRSAATKRAAEQRQIKGARATQAVADSKGLGPQQVVGTPHRNADAVRTGAADAAVAADPPTPTPRRERSTQLKGAAEAALD